MRAVKLSDGVSGVLGVDVFMVAFIGIDALFHDAFENYAFAANFSFSGRLERMHIVLWTTRWLSNQFEGKCQVA
jgi:hypothetical protein